MIPIFEITAQHFKKNFVQSDLPTKSFLRTSTEETWFIFPMQTWFFCP